MGAPPLSRVVRGSPDQPVKGRSGSDPTRARRARPSTADLTFPPHKLLIRRRTRGIPVRGRQVLRESNPSEDRPPPTRAKREPRPARLFAGPPDPPRPSDSHAADRTPRIAAPHHAGGHPAHKLLPVRGSQDALHHQGVASTSAAQTAPSASRHPQRSVVARAEHQDGDALAPGAPVHPRAQRSAGRGRRQAVPGQLRGVCQAREGVDGKVRQREQEG